MSPWSFMMSPWSFCSPTWKIASFCWGRQPCHLFGLVFSEPWDRDPLTPHLQLCSARGDLMPALPRVVTSPQPCSSNSWSGSASRWWRKAKVSSGGRGAGGLWDGDNECWGAGACSDSKQQREQTLSGEADSRGERWGEKGCPAHSLGGGEGHVKDALEGRVAVPTGKQKGEPTARRGR